MDAGTYQGQWMKGARHGYGVRKSAVQSDAATCRHVAPQHRSSLTSVRSFVEFETPAAAAAAAQSQATHDAAGHLIHARPGIIATGKPLQSALSTKPRIGFFLTGKCVVSDESGPAGGGGGGEGVQRPSLLGRPLQDAIRASISGAGAMLKRGRSAGDVPDAVAGGDSGGPHQRQRDTIAIDPAAVETYSGEWRHDRRSGHGVSERSDGLRYEGEWHDNCKCGYGVTTFAGGPDNPDGWREEGKYKNNVLLSPSKKLNLLPLRTSKVREKIDAAVGAAVRAAQLAAQKSDIANSRSFHCACTLVTFVLYVHVRCKAVISTIVVPYELYELYDWGKVPELYETL